MKRFLAFCVVITLIFCMFGCKKPQEKISETETSPKISNEIVYDWLLENGELTNGTSLSYTITSTNGDALNITANTDKTVELSYVSIPTANFEVTFTTKLISDNQHSFDCKIVDPTGTGKEYKLIVDKATFTSSSPIKEGNIIGFYIDGSFTDSILANNGKHFYEYFSSTKGETVQKEIPTEKMAVIEAIEHIFYQQAQESLCNMLDLMSSDLCVLWGIKLADLGYEKFVPSTTTVVPA